MNEFGIVNPVILFLTFVAGLTLGTIYIMSLWQTVKRLPDSSHPLCLMFASFAVRAAILLVALYFIMGGYWERLAMAVTGFILMKVLLTRRFGLNKAQ